MWELLRIQKRLAFVCLLIIVFVSLFALSVPILFKIMIDGILPDGNRRAFVLGGALLGFIALGRYGFGVMQDYVFLFHRQAMERIFLTTPIQRSTLKGISPHELLAGIKNFYSSFQFFWVQFVFYIAYALLVSSIVLIIFLCIEPIYFWISIAFMFLHALNFYAFRSAIARQAGGYIAAKGRLISQATVSMRLSTTVRSLAKEGFALLRLTEKSATAADAYARKEFLSAFQQLVQNFLVNTYFVALSLIHI